MNQIMLKKYASLVVKQGINIQKDQILVITTPIECAYFARILSEIAYESGAREVILNWVDDLSTRITYMMAPDEIFDEFPKWRKEFYTSYVKQNAAFLGIYAQDPEVMKDVSPERMMRQQKVISEELQEYHEHMMSGKITNCVVSIPTESWAKKVFPDDSTEEAVERLWNTIFKAVRADQEDPVASWEEHKNNLKRKINILQDLNLVKLSFKNSIGTDLEVELPEDHLWLGGSEFTTTGIEYIGNIPTEEIFTLPKKSGANGIVYNTLPLSYNGNIIDKFSLKFKDGEIIDFQAKIGYDTLESIINTDEGSKYLGEVALVPYNSPISNLNILFYNILFDENASCHLAIGLAFPTNIKNGENMTVEELKQHDVNISSTHVDFMFGSKDLQIIGTTKDNNEVTIFKDGNFAF